MSHAIAETSLYGSANVVDTAHVPARHVAGKAILSWDEAGAAGIATIWLIFYAVIALVVLVVN